MKGTRSIVHKSAAFMNTSLRLSTPVDRRRSSQKRHAPPEPGARDHLPGREVRGAPGLPQLGYTALVSRNGMSRSKAQPSHRTRRKPEEGATDRIPDTGRT